MTTGRISVLRPTGGVDPYDDTSDEDLVRETLPAHISAPSGVDQPVGGDKEVISAVALVPGRHTITSADRIVDEVSGETYSVVWARQRRGLGLDHVQVGLRLVNGGAGG